MPTSPRDYSDAQSILARLWRNAEGEERAALDSILANLGHAWEHHKEAAA